MNTVRLKTELRERIRRIADRKGMSVSDIHREALEAYCSAQESEIGESRFEDVIGVIEGPADLSENIGRQYAGAMAEKHAGHAR